MNRGLAHKTDSQYGINHNNNDIEISFVNMLNKSVLQYHLHYDGIHIVKPFCLPGPGNHYNYYYTGNYTVSIIRVEKYNSETFPIVRRLLYFSTLIIVTSLLLFMMNRGLAHKMDLQ
ncbi:MAG: hypothetical protein Barrevirus14_8 [Barrevirus sp.]|uniref:Uncharacterized protein n=1 Tax=Barrevirus sp. TaxID=2487763 RepID=A0A3G4ZUN9_9VIRU|nr:MAG: hypothetical protein Barrevirus14_8 [Barrevirus sp.]